ncbi:hypothetical protein FRB97_008986 [Tulasnella sp. 331]|nr:hypothetical protein FRB97_008986 [Tulasnella sp. 331]
MTRWTDPKVLAECARIFNITLVGLAGAYGWESILGLEQDWRFIKRLRRGNLWTRAPLCLYFACKYATLLSVIGVNYTNNVTQVIDCQIVYTVIELLGNIAIGSASTLLLLRCSALWRHYSPAIYPLITLSTAQWIILLYGSSTVRSSYAANGSCVVTGASSSFLAGLYSYTMALDFTVLVMTLLGISRLGTQSNNIWKLLSRNSITYCAVAVIVNAICMIIIVMRLNSIMNIMFSIPACVLRYELGPGSIDEYKIANAQKPKQLRNLSLLPESCTALDGDLVYSPAHNLAPYLVNNWNQKQTTNPPILTATKYTPYLSK